MSNIKHIQMKRGSSAKGNNPKYEINLSANFSYTWCGIGGVKKADGQVFQLTEPAISELTTLATSFWREHTNINYRVDETDRSWVSFRIAFEDGLIFESFENHGDYLPYTQSPPFENWIDEDIRIHGVDPTQKEAIIKLLQFEMELDRIFEVSRFIR